MTLAFAFQSHQLADLRRECHRDWFQQFHLHQERGWDHWGHRHDGWHWHRLLRPGGGQLPVTGRFGDYLHSWSLLGIPLRKPLHCNAKVEKRTWVMWKEKFPATRLREPLWKDGILGLNFVQVAPLQCVSSISAVCEVWKWMDKRITGHRRWALCF